jgi:hypothetical protein
MLFALMVDAPRSSTAPPKGPTIGVFSIDGGCSWISGTTTQGGASSTFFSANGGSSQISGNASEGGRH